MTPLYQATTCQMDLQSSLKVKDSQDQFTCDSSLTLDWETRLKKQKTISGLGFLLEISQARDGFLNSGSEFSRALVGLPK